ncbi:MAG TPA: type II and III secretion system protein [Lentisphaeria bacterium]|nr:type II and III secretion system protein [Lentisphaeria bacterium]
MRHITVMAALLVCSAVAVYAETSVKNEVKIEQKMAAATDAAGIPAGTAAAFRQGQLFYNAMPSTPAAGTAVKVIDSKDDMDYICKVYKLKSKDVSAEIASFLRVTVEKEGGTVYVSVNTRTGDEFIMITAPMFQFPYLEDAIAALDDEGTKFYEDGTKIGVYTMKHRLASDIGPVVEGALQSQYGLSVPDDAVNKIYYLDSPSYYDATVEYVQQFDVPPEMVRIEAQIVEVEMDDDFNFGMALEAWKEALPENVDMQLDFQQSRDRADLNMNPGNWAQFAAQSVIIQGMRPKAMANIINYLVRTGKAKVLSRPTVVAMNGQEATIASLDKVNYKAYSTADEALNKQTDVGISLTITPTIGSETLSLAINAEVSSLVGWTSSSDPIINARSTTANVVLKDGELFTLSGLRKDTITKTDERVPVLGSIPLVGYVFRHEIDVKKTSEIVVLLTPHKVTPEKSVTDKERELLQGTTDAIDAPERGEVEKFIDRVILNKK